MNYLVKRLDELNFVIGLFFGLVSLVLWLGYFTSQAMHIRMILYTATVFLIFSLAMVSLKGKSE